MIRKAFVTGILSTVLVFTAGSLFAQSQIAPAPNVPDVSSLNLTAFQVHSVVQGDTLSKIARRYYGEQGGYYFPLILFANRDQVSDPDVLYPGMQLDIPELRIDLINEAARVELKNYTMELAYWYARKGNNEMSDRLISFAGGL
ncbi:MAG: LysM peptidoglycan-binding domain-containing protein [Treponema sp.]|jgi:phage tail protein X|nr:LysM peptidoglycan-binding domain-containing protein [Treponema sp.]